MLASRSKQEEHRKNVLKVVQDALEGTVSEEWLIGVANFINQEQYNDITEERSLTKVCGYPLCKNQLGKLPSQKYHISLKTKKVYDITERKQFCSNQCFKASKYFKQQLSTSPVWLRENEKEIKVALLHTSNRSGSAGDEVDIGYNRVILEDVTSLPKKELVLQKTVTQGPFVSKQSLEKLASYMDKLKVNVKEHGSNDKEAPAVNKYNKSEKLQENLLEEGKPQDKIINESLSQEAKKSTCMNQFVDTFSNPLDLSSLSLLEPSPSHEGSKENLEDINPFNESFKNNDMQNSGGTNSYENQSGSLTTSNVRVAKTSTSDNIVWTKQAISDKTEVNKLYFEELSTNSIGNFIPTKPLPCSSMKETLSSSGRDDNSHLVIDPITAIEKALTEWVTPKTLEILLGKEKFHHILDEFQSSQGHLTNHYNDQEKQEQLKLKYLHLCRKLEINEQIENELDAEYLKKDCDEKNVLQGKLPSLIKLHDDAELFNLKVYGYFQGNLDVEYSQDDETKLKRKSQKSVTANKHKNKNSNSGVEKTKEEAVTDVGSLNTAEPVLPALDKYNANFLRRKIVLNRLQQLLSELLPILGIGVFDTTSELQRLLTTFRLSAHNITFRPAEWTVINILLLLMLAKKNEDIQVSLNRRYSQKYLNSLLQDFNTSFCHLDQTVLPKILDHRRILQN